MRKYSRSILRWFERSSYINMENKLSCMYIPAADGYYSSFLLLFHKKFPLYHSPPPPFYLALESVRGARRGLSGEGAHLFVTRECSCLPHGQGVSILFFCWLSSVSLMVRFDDSFSCFWDIFMHTRIYIRTCMRSAQYK